MYIAFSDINHRGSKSLAWGKSKEWIISWMDLGGRGEFWPPPEKFSIRALNEKFLKNSLTPPLPNNPHQSKLKHTLDHPHPRKYSCTHTCILTILLNVQELIIYALNDKVHVPTSCVLPIVVQPTELLLWAPESSKKI